MSTASAAATDASRPRSRRTPRRPAWSIIITITRKRFSRKARFVWVYPLVLWIIVAAHTTRRPLLLGAGIVTLGEAVRLWANGYVGHLKVGRTAPHQPKIGRLITAGPYAFVQHPLYFGTFLLGVGFCVIVGNLWIGVAALAAFLMTYRRKMSEEEGRLADEWAREYAAYRREVPRWLPGLRRYAARVGTWSGQGIAASKEWKTCVWVATAVVALALRADFLQTHRWMTPATRGRDLAGLAAIGALIAGDGALEWRRRHARAQ